MVRNKKLGVILAVFVLSAVLLTGCDTVEGGGGTGLGEKAEVTGSEEVNDSTQSETQAEDTVSGKLKAVDAAAGTITITAQSGDELVLKVTDESKILVDGSSSTLAQLAAEIDSGVDVEYDAETKTVTSVSIEG